MSRTSYLVGVLTTSVSRVRTIYTDLDKVSSTKPNSGRNSKLKDHDRRMLKRVVSQNCKATLPQITSEMNTHLQNHVFMKTNQQELHDVNFHGRVGFQKGSVLRGMV